MYLTLKLAISALIVAAASELAKRNVTIGALVASLPLTSLVAILWLYRETDDPGRIASLSSSILWLTLPSLLLFLILPLLLRRGTHFYLALMVAIACTVAAYAVMSVAMQRFGLRT